MEVAGPLGTPLGLAQRKRASCQSGGAPALRPGAIAQSPGREAALAPSPLCQKPGGLTGTPPPGDPPKTGMPSLGSQAGIPCSSSPRPRAETWGHEQQRWRAAGDVTQGLQAVAGGRRGHGGHSPRGFPVWMSMTNPGTWFPHRIW